MVCVDANVRPTRAYRAEYITTNTHTHLNIPLLYVYTWCMLERLLDSCVDIACREIIYLFPIQLELPRERAAHVCVLCCQIIARSLDHHRPAANERPRKEPRLVVHLFIVIIDYT